MARRDNLGKLRGLAGERGYDLQRAPISGTWFLMDKKGKPAVTDRGTTAFSVERALTFFGEGEATAKAGRY